jgi:hypothetical protein
MYIQSVEETCTEIDVYAVETLHGFSFVQFPILLQQEEPRFRQMRRMVPAQEHVLHI